MRMVNLAVGAMAVALAGAAQAESMSNLPYVGTSDWTYGAMSPGNTAYNGTTTSFETRPYAGVWFGWGTSYANTPSWTPAGNATGNYLSLTASVSADAADWSAYFYDGSNYAAFTINPTFCGSGENCYTLQPRTGVVFYFGTPDTNDFTHVFVDLDTTVSHTYEFLLKDGAVSYRVDGAGFVGDAHDDGRGSPLLVIGDGSGWDPTGVGSMSMSAITFNYAPQFSELDNVTPVPEPGEWAMMAAGLAVAGFAARRRRSEGAK